MKKNILISILGLLAVGLTSCMDTLDTHPNDFFDEETVWSSFATANAFVNGAYAQVLAESSNSDGSGMWAGNGVATFWECRTPNSVRCSEVGEGPDKFTFETNITPSFNYGVNYSNSLRKCNLIIEKAGASEVMSEAEKTQLVAEGKFLRAMIFFDQTRKMGRFLPIMQVFSQSDTITAKEIRMTSSIDESYQIVVNDFEDAVAGLPLTAKSGRANKYAAETMLSEACLQAYAYTQDEKYLDKAIAAAEDVVAHNQLSSDYAGMFNGKNSYDPEILLGYYYLKEDTYVSSFCELINVGANIQSPELEEALCETPWVSPSGGPTWMGWGIFWPTQDLVDQYLAIDEKTKEALPWWETSQWKDNVIEKDPSSVTEPGQVDQYTGTSGFTRHIPSSGDFKNVNVGYPQFTRYAELKADRTDTRNISELMYQNRDKRFYSSVVYDHSQFLGETMDMNINGNASIGVRCMYGNLENGGYYNTVTNYYWRKCVPDDISCMYYGEQVDYHYCIVRTAMAYLNLAEAYLCKKNLPKALEALNATRTIHGGLPESKASSIEEAWTDYIREHNVELCNESAHCYFSYLRWGKYGGAANAGRPGGDVIAALEAPVHKVMISRDRSKVLISQVTLENVSNRKFTTKRYLLPIQQSFLDTREAYGLDCEQNPGW